MSNQPAEDLPQGWSMVIANEVIMEMEMLVQVLEQAWQAEQQEAVLEEMREAILWKKKTTAEIGRRLAKDLAGLKK
ncbi:hypothetical protein MKX07_002463 [Trichoderma sp. CBMAI-0711]|uniref:Uncharacterized protein n=1 Tax=Trichoderma parareesei TaxID=858221 RepID=A0A2H2Z354_TRIPA|nr:hypothetical protein MKX07_002463 [Trichoderma sp. CBMAI-0711]OTA02697.1 hypothetical protein A9Z42_0030980 [Trichoderma parareesei]